MDALPSFDLIRPRTLDELMAARARNIPAAVCLAAAPI